MATVISFPMARSQATRDPALRSLRDRLGELRGYEAAGWQALRDAMTGKSEVLDPRVLRERLAADISSGTWRDWLAAVGRSQALPAAWRGAIRLSTPGGGTQP